MIATASSEFIALCQSQVLLLTETLGAASTVVYLTKPGVNLSDPTLVPLVAYPDTADTWAGLNDALSTMVDSLPEQASLRAPDASASLTIAMGLPPPHHSIHLRGQAGGVGGPGRTQRFRPRLSHPPPLNPP
ncbi:MAG: hypothetical protein HC922_06835 [Leptolyngbyaceae cyanobacterium SM2_3_12]|nr:hypothetical protein [Leptolyngbyaceae cyanobacterium SM2_3_12]